MATRDTRYGLFWLLIIIIIILLALSWGATSVTTQRRSGGGGRRQQQAERKESGITIPRRIVDVESDAAKKKSQRVQPLWPKGYAC